jgi:hypothetical protein
MAQASKNRVLRALGTAAAATVRSCGRASHQLWLEVTGSVFLGMAGIGLIAIGRSYAKYSAGRGTVAGVAVAVCFTLTFAWFGLSSFWRVRKRDSSR